MPRITHGETKGRRKTGLTTEFIAWTNMKDRCYNPNAANYPRYGGRGIAVCPQWLHSFSQFLSDMGRKPAYYYTLGRENNDGNYTPENCRWETMTEQQRNRSSNRNLTFAGQTRTLTEWAQITGISEHAIAKRLDKYGMTVAVALTRPVRWHLYKTHRLAV